MNHRFVILGMRGNMGRFNRPARFTTKILMVGDFSSMSLIDGGGSRFAGAYGREKERV